MLWNEIEQDMRFLEVDVTAAFAENPSATESSPLSNKRTEFFARCESEDFQGLINELIPPKQATIKSSIFKRVIRKMKNIIARILA